MRAFAQLGLITIFSLTIVFHTFVMMKIIPYAIVWGGRLKNDAAMYKFEAVSLVLNTTFLFVVLLKSTYLNIQVPITILDTILWVMAGLFLLNTIGNLMSKNRMERLLFTPITLILSLFLFIVLLNY